MALTPAERSRRYRERQKAHTAGDQPVSTPSGPNVTPPVTVTDDRDAVTLGPAGRRLWTELDGDGADGGERVLIVEACRIADRLGQLDRLLRGDALDWLEIVETKGNPERQELVINAPLAEARQQATALKQIVSELRQTAPAGKTQPRRGQGGQARTSGTGAEAPPVKEGGGVVADLAVWVANRGAPAAG